MATPLDPSRERYWCERRLVWVCLVQKEGPGVVYCVLHYSPLKARFWLLHARDEAWDGEEWRALTSSAPFSVGWHLRRNCSWNKGAGVSVPVGIVRWSGIDGSLLYPHTFSTCSSYATNLWWVHPDLMVQKHTSSSGATKNCSACSFWFDVLSNCLLPS